MRACADTDTDTDMEPSVRPQRTCQSGLCRAGRMAHVDVFLHWLLPARARTRARLRASSMRTVPQPTPPRWVT